MAPKYPQTLTNDPVEGPELPPPGDTPPEPEQITADPGQSSEGEIGVTGEKPVNERVKLLGDAIRAAYDVRRVLYKATGQSMPPWSSAKQSDRHQLAEDVLYLLGHVSPQASSIHERWVDEQEKAGWRYGVQLDEEAKRSPEVKPFAQLTQTERAAAELVLHTVFAVIAEKRYVPGVEIKDREFIDEVKALGDD